VAGHLVGTGPFFNPTSGAPPVLPYAGLPVTLPLPANLCFGGPDGKTLFITARRSLYSIPVLIGAPQKK